MQKLFLILCSFLLASAPAAAQQESRLQLGVEKAVVAKAVEGREPVGVAKEFNASVGQVSCWTKVIAATVPTKIKHVWYVDNQKVFEMTLDIHYHKTRTWSTKKIRPGNWRVDVTDATGNILTSVSFTVK